MTNIKLVKRFKDLVEKDDLKSIKEELADLADRISSKKKKDDEDELIINDINQIIKTRTIERTKYYLNRLIKSISEKKEGKINDINLNQWKKYNDIITDSLWIMDKRDKTGSHTADYWGNFIPQIPSQFLRRYTKKNEWVLDTFLGSGTTLIECKRLARNGIGIELSEKVASIAKKNIKGEKSNTSITTKVVNGNSITIDYKKTLKDAGTDSVQFIIMHPPYWDIIKFSEKKDDLSNAKNIDEFLKMFSSIVKVTYPVLDKGRYLAVVIGDKYSAGEWIPLGFYTMQEVLKHGYKLKSTIVKNFEATKGKRNNKELWRYRALAGGFYIFKHEYIFLFQKV